MWVGFDRVAPLGKRETGAQAALPMWMDYMRVALADMPESEIEQPAGVVTVRIDPDTGLLAGANNSHAIFESFRAADMPGRADEGGEDGLLPAQQGGERTGSTAAEQIF